MFEEKLKEFQPIFYPKSIAVVGASATSIKAGSLWVEDLRSAGYAGPIYPIGTSGGRLGDLEILPSLRLIPSGGRFIRSIPPSNGRPTYLFPTYDDYSEGGRNIVYGRLGGPTHRALEDAINVLEGGYETRLAPSGLQAANAALLAFVKAGDRILVTDSAYDPTRKFCDNFLRRCGVETVYYDPIDVGRLGALMTPNSKVVFAESPGSLTFEVQDLAELSKAARNAGAKLIVDNTWSGGVFLKPLAHGADVVVHAGTKYFSGHSELSHRVDHVRRRRNRQDDLSVAPSHRLERPTRATSTGR